ncbi:MAG: hypothetical protein ACFBSD_00605 [Paracoccaceae bacterium]
MTRKPQRRKAGSKPTAAASAKSAAKETRRTDHRLLKYGGPVLLALLVLAELLVDKHPYFALQGSFGFAAWFGAGAAFVLIGLAYAYGRLFDRDEEESYDD